MLLVRHHRRLSSVVGGNPAFWRGRARFYQIVDVSEDRVVRLDGHKLRTPGQNSFQLPTMGLALVVAQELDAQMCIFETSLMPVTMQSAVCIDLTHSRRDHIVGELLRYLNTDIVCFPEMENSPDDLAGDKKALRMKQNHSWQKALDHFYANYGTLNILDYETLRSPQHPVETVEKAKIRLQALDDWKLTAVHSLAQGCKSLVLPLALLDEKITSQEAFVAARVEELYQIERWGLVEGAHDVDRESLMAQITAATVMIDLS